MRDPWKAVIEVMILLGICSCVIIAVEYLQQKRWVPCAFFTVIIAWCLSRLFMR